MKIAILVLATIISLPAFSAPKEKTIIPSSSLEKRMIASTTKVRTNWLDDLRTKLQSTNGKIRL